LANVRFESASAYALPFPDDVFDAALAHTLLVHLSEPVRVLRELRRVVRPGGVVAVSDDDFGTVLAPPNPLVEEAISLLVRVVQHNGGNPYYARHLRRHLLDAGFARSEGHAVAADYYGTLDETRRFAALAEPWIRDPAFVEIVVATAGSIERAWRPSLASFARGPSVPTRSLRSLTVPRSAGLARSIPEAASSPFASAEGRRH
jgi:SAM-dependent methyltransferase